jgi:hypothetical protein
MFHDFMQFKSQGLILLLAAFTKLRKATINFVMSVCMSVRMDHLSSHWPDFHDI